MTTILLALLAMAPTQIDDDTRQRVVRYAVTARAAGVEDTTITNTITSRTGAPRSEIAEIVRRTRGRHREPESLHVEQVAFIVASADAAAVSSAFAVALCSPLADEADTTTRQTCETAEGQTFAFERWCRDSDDAWTVVGARMWMTSWQRDRVRTALQALPEAPSINVVRNADDAAYAAAATARGLHRCVVAGPG